jgi:hypothetical protein
MASVLALKVSINRIDYFEAWAYAKTDIINLSLYGSNRIIDTWVPPVAGVENNNNSDD